MAVLTTSVSELCRRAALRRSTVTLHPRQHLVQPRAKLAVRPDAGVQCPDTSRTRTYIIQKRLGTKNLSQFKWQRANLGGKQPAKQIVLFTSHLLRSYRPANKQRLSPNLKHFAPKTKQTAHLARVNNSVTFH